MDVPADRPLSASEEALIRVLQPVLKELQRRMDDDLVRAHRMTTTEYLTLMHLSEAPNQQLPISVLASRCNQSTSAISRTVTRLAADDLVGKEQSADDARSFAATITPRGLTRLEEAWPTHLRSVRRNILDHLGGVDIEMLTLALQSMLDESDA